LIMNSPIINRNLNEISSRLQQIEKWVPDQYVREFQKELVNIKNVIGK
jgi:hypothetical protein